MSNYGVISEVGEALVKLLREKMIPNAILNDEQIQLCHPEDRGDVVLSISLYDIRESEQYRDSRMIQMGTRTQKYPSTYLSLDYMITAYASGEMKHRNLEEHKLLGYVIQILRDFHTIETENEIPLSIEMLDLSLDEKHKIWTVPNKGYKLSLFYRVSPVEVMSAKKKDVRRVVDLDMTFKEQ